MTELQAIEAIYEQWQSGWEAIHPSIVNDAAFVPYVLDDEAFKPDVLGALGCWVTVSVRHSTRDQATQGVPSEDECIGNVFVQIFGPKNEGVGKLVQLAEDVRTAIAKRRINEVNMYAGRSLEGPKDPAWAVRIVVIPFRYRTTPT